MSNNLTNLSNHSVNRRQFLRQAACAALGATAMVNTLATLRLTTASIAKGAALNDYKALVCLQLNGGNDSNNMLFPIGAADPDSLRDDYEKGRGALALSSDGVTPLAPETSTAFTRYHGGIASPVAVHPNAPGIGQLFADGDLGFICNVGTLVHQIESRQDYINKIVAAPPDLFSHADQQMQWQTSVPDKPMQTGWGGRIADLLHEDYSGEDSNVSMSISLGGVNTFQRGLDPASAAFAISAKGAKSLVGYNNASTPLYYHAVHTDSTFDAPIYKNSTPGHRLKALENLARLTSGNLLEDGYAGRVVSNRRVATTINDAVSTANDALYNGSPVDFDQIFTNAGADHALGDQLKMVARLIAGHDELGNNRQIFYVSVGGYDIHNNHLGSHADLMDELSTGLVAFRSAMQAIGQWDDVVAFTMSDFNRTLTPNGDDAAAGTDHAWGGHAIVTGGPVKGGNLYGHFPTLKLGPKTESAATTNNGSIDAHRGRGRWIPSTSVDQYFSVIAKWFGVESSEMAEIFPNLGRFDDPVSSTLANMNFLKPEPAMN